jgi:thiosulfate/3-mercaptopyruvate sulfurtransferase
MSNFVTSEWLAEHLNDNDLLIVDCRANLFDKEYGKRVYEKGHIRNAFFLDVKKDLADEPKEHGGRSPLPELHVLKEKLESIGMTNSKTVIAYDETELAGAERLWWMLKYLGHEKAYVLNGGIKTWINDGYELTSEVPTSNKGMFKINLDPSIITDILEIRSKMGKEGFIILDSRAPERYRGEIEPIDRKAGHIPGAKNYFWKNALNEKGQFKSKEELKDIYKSLGKYDEIVLQCGSGIDGCGNFIAMDEIGFKPKLYVGSWSDWVSYNDNPVATGEE